MRRNPNISPVTFEDRIFKLFDLRATDSDEFKTWLAIYGREKLEKLKKKYLETRSTKGPVRTFEADADGWTLVDSIDLDVLKPRILEYGNSMPGGSIYVKLISTVQVSESQLVS